MNEWMNEWMNIPGMAGYRESPSAGQNQGWGHRTGGLSGGGQAGRGGGGKRTGGGGCCGVNAPCTFTNT